MAKNISVAGTNYNAVPSIQTPLQGGGTAKFFDVSDTTATASDVASGKMFYAADGTYTTGTNSGGGGSGLTLLATQSLGTLSTTSTSATDTGKTMTVTGYNDYDILVVDVSVNTQTNNRHTSTVSLVMMTGTSNVTNKNNFAVASNKWNSRLSNNVGITRQSTTVYGIWAQSVSISSNTMTISFYYKYNSTNTGTINGSYTARVYGLNLYDLIGG